MTDIYDIIEGQHKKHGFPIGWVSVYRNGNPVHHFSDRDGAEAWIQDQLTTSISADVGDA